MASVTYAIILCFFPHLGPSIIDYKIKGSKGFITVCRERWMLLFVKRKRPGKGCPLLRRRYGMLCLTSAITGSFHKGQIKTQGSKEFRLACFYFTVFCKLPWVTLCCKEQVPADDLRCPFWVSLTMIQPIRGLPLPGEMLCFSREGWLFSRQGGVQSRLGLKTSGCCVAGWFSWTD